LAFGTQHGLPTRRVFQQRFRVLPGRLALTAEHSSDFRRMTHCRKAVDTPPAVDITMPDIAHRNMPFSTKEVSREILLSFWKVHVLHHAREAPLHGQWMLDELRHHGYSISPGTLYPLLARMERIGWLKSKTDRRGGPRARRNYRLTAEGQKVLAHVRQQIQELYDEVVAANEKGRQ